MTSDVPQDSPTWPPAPNPANVGGAAYPPVPQPGALQDASPDASATDRAWTIVGSTKRRGDWVVPERLVLPVALGDVVIDLRQARFTAATTTIEVQGLMGDVKIIVPDAIRVECSGSAIVGEFKDVPPEVATTPALSAGVVRVVGAMIFGQVRVFRTADAVGEARYAIDGMAGWRAQRRRRRERRRLRRHQGIAD